MFVLPNCGYVSDCKEIEKEILANKKCFWLRILDSYLIYIYIRIITYLNSFLYFFHSVVEEKKIRLNHCRHWRHITFCPQNQQVRVLYIFSFSIELLLSSSFIPFLVS